MNGCADEFAEAGRRASMGHAESSVFQAGGFPRGEDALRGFDETTSRKQKQ